MRVMSKVLILIVLLVGVFYLADETDLTSDHFEDAAHEAADGIEDVVDEAEDGV